MKLIEITNYLEELYPLELAESWDHPGLVAGDPNQEINSIILALDPTIDVLNFIDQLPKPQNNLIITHHPLFFRSVHKIGGNTFRGQFLNKLLRNDNALYNAHTNADSARNGVNDALCELLKIKNTSPIIPNTSNPNTGLGRVGELETPLKLKEFAQFVSDSLPMPDVRVQGDLERIVTKIALLGGSGDSIFDAVESTNADVYLTSDLRHHPVLDAKFERSFAIIDTPHFSSESPWLKLLDKLLTAEFNDTLTITHYDKMTDPWDLQIH